MGLRDRYPEVWQRMRLGNPRVTCTNVDSWRCLHACLLHEIRLGQQTNWICQGSGQHCRQHHCGVSAPDLNPTSWFYHGMIVNFSEGVASHFHQELELLLGS